MKNKSQKLTSELKKRGILKTFEIYNLGVSREYLRLLTTQGVVVRVSRGYYCLPDYDFSATKSIAEVSKKNPKEIICLLSALRVHGFTTQNPFEVWIAIDRGTWQSKVKVIFGFGTTAKVHKLFLGHQELIQIT